MKRKCRKCGYLGQQPAPGAAPAAAAPTALRRRRLEVRGRAATYGVDGDDGYYGSDGGYDDDGAADEDNDDADDSGHGCASHVAHVPRLNEPHGRCSSVAAAATLDAAPVSCASTAP